MYSVLFDRSSSGTSPRSVGVAAFWSVDGGSVSSLEGYFDETDRHSGVYAVCGYLFEPWAARQYAIDARQLFAPYGPSHMKTLVHRKGGFRGISEGQKDELLKAHVKVINRWMTAGVTVSCWRQDVENYSPDFIRGFAHAYSVCTHLAAANLGHWLRCRWPGGNGGGVRYFFEENTEHYADANVMLSNAKTMPTIKALYQYKEHVWASKVDTPPLWAADMLAWEWGKYWDETLVSAKRPMRRSLMALLREGWDFTAGRNPRYRLFHLGGDQMVTYFDRIRALGMEQLQEEKGLTLEQADVTLPEQD